MSTQLSLDGSLSEVELAARRPTLCFTVDGEHYRVSERTATDEAAMLIEIDGRSFEVWRVREGDRIHLKLDGRTWSVGYQEAVNATALAGSASHEIRAEMPGVVVTIHAMPGARVAAGDPLLVLESMKMQITLAAPRAAVVAAVHVECNAPFQKGALLLSFEAPE